MTESFLQIRVNHKSLNMIFDAIKKIWDQCLCLYWDHIFIDVIHSFENRSKDAMLLLKNIISYTCFRDFFHYVIQLLCIPVFLSKKH